MTEIWCLAGGFIVRCRCGPPAPRVVLSRPLCNLTATWSSSTVTGILFGHQERRATKVTDLLYRTTAKQLSTRRLIPLCGRPIPSCRIDPSRAATPYIGANLSEDQRIRNSERFQRFLNLWKLKNPRRMLSTYTGRPHLRAIVTPTCVLIGFGVLCIECYRDSASGFQCQWDTEIHLQIAVDQPRRSTSVHDLGRLPPDCCDQPCLRLGEWIPSQFSVHSRRIRFAGAGGIQ